MNNQNIVSVSDLRKTYGGKNERQYEALKGINFDVQTGEFVGIMGASGSGKTTLLNMLATLDKPTSGQVLINQQDVTRLKGNQIADFRSKEIGFIFQDFNLLETLTAEENIALPLSLQAFVAALLNKRFTPLQKLYRSKTYCESTQLNFLVGKSNGLPLPGPSFINQHYYWVTNQLELWILIVHEKCWNY